MADVSFPALSGSSMIAGELQQEEQFQYEPEEFLFHNNDASEFVSEGQRDRKHLSLGMLVPDAIQYICSEGTALRWDDQHGFYEVIRDV